MLCVVEPERLDEVLAVCARWEVNGTAIGEVTDTRRLRVFDGDELVGDMPVMALVDECPAYDLAPAEPADADLPGAAARCCTRDGPGRDRCSRCSGSANLASRQLGVRAVRLRSSARAPSAGPSRPTPPSCCSTARDRHADGARAPARDRGGDRRQRPPRRRRSLPRRGRGRRRVLGEPRLRRRRAARADELPELRQPGEAAHRLAAHARGRRARRRLPRVRHPGRRRQRLALQRGRRGPDLPDAGRRPGRRAAGRARAPGRLGFAAAGRRDRADRRRLVGAVARRPPSWPSCAASAVEGPLPSADLGELKALHAAIRQAVRSGALHSAHDVAEGGVAVALAECASPPASAPTVSRPAARTSCSARARARSSSPARPRR